MFTCHLHDAFSESQGKVISEKGNREPRREGAGEIAGLGFIFISATSLTLFSSMFLCKSV